ncbi:RHS repeat-associated core domain-containing protein [Catenulispora yoronensis]|uniref:RHS repeat-associated core domain-containing protein n=1 Tax=Catenulispora yoronensis TaxID=450799 RepID=UPI0031D18A52
MTLSVTSHDAAQQAGVAGMIVTAVRADSGAAAAPATVAVDYSSFATAFGGDFADRMALVALPACSLTTPDDPSCRQQTPVPFTNDRQHHKLVATVQIPAAASVSSKAASAALVLAASSTPSGMNGSYTATSLTPSDTWNGAGNEGSFAYTYPITTPASLGGAAPSVALAYNSASVDGRTAASNAQGSWVGDGWDYNPGFIERSYKPCSKAGFPASADECWGIPNATLSLPGHSGELVRDDATGAWRIAGDDGTRVEQLTGATNGNAGDGGAYWKLTTTDGTEYYFGANRLPQADEGTNSPNEPPTFSAWGVPVFGTGSPAGSKCASPTTAVAADCRTGWRWNLDFVVDPHHNLTRYTYAREENFYLRGTSNSPTEYQAGGFLRQIDYGWRSNDYYNTAVHPAASVTFNPVARCISDTTQAGHDSRCPVGTVPVSGGLAQTGINAANAPSFVDTPWDQACTSAGTKDGTAGGAKCVNYIPSFFNTERLDSVTTNVWTGSAYRRVDQYTLMHQFNAVPDPSTAGNQPTLWLAGIKHSGWVVNQDGTTAQADDPTVYTYGQFLPNRAATHSFNATNNASDYNRLRLAAITDTTGSEVDVSYSDPSTLCPGPTAPTITANSTLCYPEYWTIPGGTTPVLDWFNKYTVTSVMRYDDTLLAAARRVSYTYLGTPVWHTNDSEQTETQYRTFDQFRGYAQVQTVVGSEIDNSNTKQVATYFRGMDQDGNATYPFQDANKHVWVVDGHGDVFAPGVPGLRDDNSLAGQVLETQTYASSGSSNVVSDVVNVPVDPTSSGPSSAVNLHTGGPDPGNMVTAAHDRGSGLPTQRAHFSHTSKTVTYQKVSTGTRRSEVDYDYDNTLPNPVIGSSGGNGRLLMTDDKGDGTVQELCSVTGYALQAANTQRTAIPWQSTKLLGPCVYGVKLTDSNLVSDTVTLFDGSPNTSELPGPGDPTTVRTAGSIHLTDPATGTYAESWATAGATFDGSYGRVTSVTDADQHTTHTDYTPSSGALPSSYKVTNPAGWAATTTLDQGRGIPETSTDVNGHLTTEMLDGMGRLKGVWKPDRPWTTNRTLPNIRFTYLLNGTTPHLATTTQPAQPNGYAETETLLEDGSYAATFNIVDGFGDVVQTQSPAVDESHGRMIVNTRYDTLGRVMETNLPYFDQGATIPTGVWASWNDNLPAQTVTTYDGMSRPITVTQKHNGSTIAGMVTTTSYPGVDRTDVVGPGSNGVGPSSATSTFTDVRGRTTSLWTYKNSPLSPTGNANDADVTSYGFAYNPGGTEGTASTVTDATAHNVWTTTTSDLLGHQVIKTDPDAGTSTSYSDNAGLLLATADGRGHVLGYTYDVLNRRTGEYDGGIAADHSVGAVATAGAQATGNGAAKLAAWTFDPAGNKGEPDASTRIANGNAYTQQVTGYDVDYRPLGAKTVIPASEGLLAGTYQTSNYYTSQTGLIDHYDTPSVPNAGIGPETVYNSYNRFGLLMATGGNADYLAATTYDRDGKILSTTLGDYPFQIVQQNLYDAGTGRVTNTFVDTTAGQSTVNPTQLNTYSIDEVSYAYDAAGRLTSTADLQNWSVSGSYNPGPAQRDIQCYTYDYASRLTNAWSDSGDQSPSATTNPNSPTTATSALGSCASSTANNAPTDASSRTQIGGPARYWQSYTYTGSDAQSGNRTSVTDHDPAGITANNITRTSSYAAPGATNIGGATNPGTGPHLLGQITKSGAATGTEGYSYDGAGNTTLRPNGTALGQQLTWDAEGRLKHVDNNNGTTADYLYDADGNQLIRRDTGGTTAGTTLYVGTTEIHLAGTNTVTANRYYNYPGAPGIIVTSTGAITYQVNNNQGTGGTTINAATGKVIARRYIKPFGETRGTPATQTTSPAWTDDHTFLGKTTDASTALVDIGARKYDPVTGRFISIDPQFQPADPQAIGGYSYAGNDPVDNSDPSGLRYAGESSAGWNVYHPPGEEQGSFGEFVAGAGHWVVHQANTAFQLTPVNKIVSAGATATVDHTITSGGANAPSGQVETQTISPESAYDNFIVSHHIASQRQMNSVSTFLDIASTFSPAGKAKDADLLEGGLRAAAKRLITKPAEACTHSFAPGTRVLMADGLTKSIEDVKAGDEIENAQPDGATEHHKVDEVHKTLTDTDFTDLTITTPSGPKIITGTQNHPYWDATTGRFTNASQLKPGDRLQSDDSTPATVAAVHNYTSAMVTYDLTIDGLHTYYVVAGGTPVLVHNCGGEATVHLTIVNGVPDHALITVRSDSGEVLPTHQFGSVKDPRAGVEVFNPATRLDPDQTFNIKIPLPNADGALAYAEVMMEKTAAGTYPSYSLRTQSCVTYCANVLRAGGVEGVPTTPRAAQAWFFEQFG